MKTELFLPQRLVELQSEAGAVGLAVVHVVVAHAHFEAITIRVLVQTIVIDLSNGAVGADKTEMLD